jgi:hypothetical protein
VVTAGRATMVVTTIGTTRVTTIITLAKSCDTETTTTMFQATMISTKRATGITTMAATMDGSDRLRAFRG